MAAYSDADITKIIIDRNKGVAPRSLKTLISICRAVIEYPNTPSSVLIHHIDASQATAYSGLKFLRSLKIITHDNVFQGGLTHRFQVPAIIQSGQHFPDDSYVLAHMAAYLARYEEEDIVGIYKATKRDILEEINEVLLEDTPTTYQIMHRKLS